MNREFTTQLKQKMTIVICCLLLFFLPIGIMKAVYMTYSYSNPGTIVVLGIDKSLSVADYRQLDTSFVATICRSIGMSGGLVVVYLIGEPTDRAGMRCYLKRVPKMDNNLVISKQAELKMLIKNILAENENQILIFLKKVQSQVFESDSQGKIIHTDINGFFKKVDALLDEPQILLMNRIVFAYTDGIQSLGSRDCPANYRFSTRAKFTLCLSGWKTQPLSNSISPTVFEDPEGFLRYLETNISQNH